MPACPLTWTTATPSHPRLSRRAAVLALLAPGLVIAGSARANDVVVMKSGSRLEVTRAYVDGDEIFCTLPSGGSVRIAQSAVRRVSGMSEDQPTLRPALVAESTGSGASGGATTQAWADPVAPPLGVEVERPLVVASLGRAELGAGTPHGDVMRGASAADSERTRVDDVRSQVAGPAGPSALLASAYANTTPEAAAASRRERLRQAARPTPEKLRAMLTRVQAGRGSAAAPVVSSSVPADRATPSRSGLQTLR